MFDCMFRISAAICGGQNLFDVCNSISMVTSVNSINWGSYGYKWLQVCNVTGFDHWAAFTCSNWSRRLSKAVLGTGAPGIQKVSMEPRKFSFMRATSVGHDGFFLFFDRFHYKSSAGSTSGDIGCDISTMQHWCPLKGQSVSPRILSKWSLF